MKRSFLHVDMDAFFAAVEQRDRPELRGKPVVVGAPPDRRGVVAAASYEARQFGIHSAMPSREAGRRCPQAVFLPVDGERYEKASREIFAILETFTPLVEPLSIDEAFLDVSGARLIHGTAEEIARKIKETVRRKTGLTASVGVAPNKFLAKLASELSKPDGLLVIPEPPEEIVAFLAPLPVSRLWGVGKVTRRHLESAGIRTVGDLQSLPADRLSRITGKAAAESLLHLARGEDLREIEMDRREKSMSREHTFPEDCRERETVEAVLLDLVEDVGNRLRLAGKHAAVVHLKLRWHDFRTITRQLTLDAPCCDDFTLREAALSLFRAQPLSGPVRLIGFGVGGLADGVNRQLSLFKSEGQPRERKERLSRAVDAIRRRFGEEVIGRADARRGAARAGGRPG
ncbi:MAG: DNA polymerase IV [Lentisphaerae bacterium]|nr:DNA polymerase IV [Lentisphaerota bacterium]